MDDNSDPEGTLKRKHLQKLLINNVSAYDVHKF